MRQNVEKLFHQRLRRGNRSSNVRDNGTALDRFMSFPQKILMKKQMMMKINLDLSTAHCLFGVDLEQKFDHHETMSSTSNNGFCHTHSTRRTKDFFCTAGEKNVIATTTIKKIGGTRWLEN